jgi:hypothetical protein
MFGNISYFVMELFKIKGIYALDLFSVCKSFLMLFQDQWKIKDPAFIKQSEEFAVTRFKEWIMEQTA